MSLILAIEPNKNQAHQLSALVRAHLKAELVTAPTAAAALSALGDRIPDVVLTPALFGLRDEAALQERLRQLGSDASHVQTLALPILASGPSRGPNGGLLGRKKDKGDSDVGCDPAVFAEQIKIYLQRAAVERRAQASETAARTMAPSAGSPPPEELSPFMMGADELDVDSLELASIPPPVPAEPTPEPEPKVTAARERSKGKHTASPLEAELGLVTPPAAGPPLWKVTERVEDFYGQGDGVDPAFGTASVPAAASPVSSNPVNAQPAAEVKPARRARRTPPQPDEWTYFDPSQSAFKALIKRLDEIAGSAA